MKNAKPVQFSFLVHPRDMGDIKKNYPYLKFIPNIILEIILLFVPPLKIGMVTGLHNKQNIPTQGYLICVCVSARTMLLLPRFFVNWHIVRAVKLSKKLGAELVGLGMFTSPMTHGGVDLVDKYDIGITNGNALTASMTLDAVEKLLEVKKLNISDAQIAVIGATGSVGTAVSIGLMKQNPKHLILIGRTAQHVADLGKELRNLSTEENANETMVTISTNMNEVKQADIIITATASPKALLKAEHFKKNVAVCDVAQPNNVDSAVRKERPDVIVVDGGIVAASAGVVCDADTGLEQGMFFACMSETMLLATEGRSSDFSIGKVSFEHVLEMKKLAQKHNFELAPLKNWGESPIPY